MPHHIIIKVYGNIWPVNEDLMQALVPLMPFSEHVSAQDMLNLHNDLLTISFEGIYFPLDEVLEVMQAFLRKNSQGKLDYIDLEAWTLIRHEINGMSITSKTTSLNNVMDFSGH